MKSLLLLLIISLAAMLTVLGCSAQVSANPDNQKIVIKYSTIIYGEP